MAEQFREVIRDHQFERDLRSLIRGARAGDQCIEGAEFLLARDPLVGSPTDDPLVWVPAAGASRGKTGCALYCAFDAQTVWL